MSLLSCIAKSSSIFHLPSSIFNLRIYQSPDLHPIRVSPLKEYRTIRIGRFPQRPHPACIGKHQSLRPCVRQPRNQARTGLKNVLSPEVCDGAASRTESSTEQILCMRYRADSLDG